MLPSEDDRQVEERSKFHCPELLEYAVDCREIRLYFPIRAERQNKFTDYIFSRVTYIVTLAHYY